jgi:thymidylate synthase
VDQISEVLEQIKKNPDSRRLIVSAWNAAEIEYGFSALSYNVSVLCSRWKIVFAILPKKCRCIFGRSFQYCELCLLCMMMAQVCGLEVGDYVHTFGDVHIYNNHFEQVNLQLSREPRDLPTMKLNPEIKDFLNLILKILP